MSIIVRDPAIAPYSLTIDEDQISISKRSKSYVGKTKGQETDVAFKHFNRMETAIDCIVKMKMAEQKEGEVAREVTLRQYLEEYKTRASEINKAICQYTSMDATPVVKK